MGRSFQLFTLILSLCISVSILTNSPAIEIQTQPIASGFTEPILVTHAGDGSGRLFVVQQQGRIRIISGGGALAEDFLDLGATGLDLLSTGGSEQGLLGMAFDPDYENNGEFYVHYTRKPARPNEVGDSIVARFSVSESDPNRALLTQTIILGPVAQPQTNHNGGMIAFGADNHLYIALGDGGNGDDVGPGHNPTIGNGQDLTQLLGKILRIDVHNPQTPLAYGIPSDNPFASGAGGARREIYAYGLRNPWRFSFDRSSGALFCADVGQNINEEVDRVIKGGNYGWRRMEGFSCFNPSTGCNDGTLQLPLVQYTHGEGCSITGGYVYRGSQYPSLRGLYFFGDYCTKRIWTIAENGQGVWGSRILQATLPSNVSSFGEDEAGELYVCGHADGIIYRIVDLDAQPTPTPTPPPTPTPTPPPTPTFNHVDPDIILYYVLGRTPDPTRLDVNNDQKVDVADLILVLLHEPRTGEI